MEGQNEFDVAPRDLSHLVKGKRTKRQRPQSPISIPITTHDPPSKDRWNHHNSSSSAESTTTEEEDTAKCLILLAQGHHLSSKKGDDDDDDDDDDDQDFEFNSKKYIEPGTRVYECKTCNRAFASFQALGGHRASHKKPKNATTVVLPDEDQDHDRVSFRQKIYLSSSLSLQLTNPTNKFSSSRKVHECSYCGAEFMSGQALGGHMRRHRGGPAVATNTALPLSSPSPASFDNQECDELSKKPRNGRLSLDLNLPAPEDDPNHTFALNSKKQQQQQKEGGLSLYTPPTLVGCHY